MPEDNILGAPQLSGPGHLQRDTALGPVMDSSLLKGVEYRGALAPEEGMAPSVTDPRQQADPATPPEGLLPDAPQRTRGAFSVQPGELGWAVRTEDFNPAGYRPNESRSAGVGKYQGGPIFSSPLAFPTGVIASRMQGIAQRERAVQEQYAKLYPEVADINNPKWNDPFKRWAHGSLQRFFADMEAVHGRRRAMELLTNPASKENRMYQELVSDIDNVAKGVNSNLTDALGIIKGQEDGTQQADPTTYQVAQDYVNKAGNTAGMTPREFALVSDRLQSNISFDKLMKDMAIPTALREAASKEDLVSLVKRGGALYSPGFVTYLNEAKTIRPKELIDRFTEELALRFPKMRKEDIRSKLESYVPQDLEQKISTHQIRSSRGGSGGSGDGGANPAANYTVEMTSFPADTQNLGGGGNEFTGSYPTITLYGSSNKQATLAKPLTFRYGNFESFMYPERIMLVGNTPFIIGKEVGMPRTRAEIEAAAARAGETYQITADQINAYNEDPTSDEGRAAIQKFGILRPRRVPLQGNEAQIEGLGYDVERVRRELGAHEVVNNGTTNTRGDSQPATPSPTQQSTNKVPQFVIDGGYSQSDWDDLTEVQKSVILKAGKL